MNTKRISFVNIVVLSSLVLAVALVWTVGRYGFLSNRDTLSFKATQELVIYPTRTEIKPMPTPAVKEVEKVVAKSAAKKVSAPKIGPVPLPLIPPRLIFQVLPDYPVSALKEGTQGTVLLRVFVSTDGQADDVRVKTSSGNRSLDKSAAEALSSWKFEPAKRGAQAIASWFEVPVRFKIK